MKRCLTVLCIVVIALLAVPVMAQYDQAAVKEAMREVGGLYGAASKAAEAEEYFTAAENLMGIAKVFKSLDTIIPEKAPKEDWDRIHGAMIKAAFKGIGACGEEDQEALKAAIADLGKFKSEGHKMFK